MPRPLTTVIPRHATFCGKQLNHDSFAVLPTRHRSNIGGDLGIMFDFALCFGVGPVSLEGRNRRVFFFAVMLTSERVENECDRVRSGSLESSRDSTPKRGAVTEDDSPLCRTLQW
jgi:hypothetical protein